MHLVQPSGTFHFTFLLGLICTAPLQAELVTQNGGISDQLSSASFENALADTTPAVSVADATIPAVLDSLSNMNEEIFDDPNISPGDVLQSEQLLLITASNYQQAVVAGNQISLGSSSTEMIGTNRIEGSFANAQGPLMVSQNLGEAASISQSMVLQIGLDKLTNLTQ